METRIDTNVFAHAPRHTTPVGTSDESDVRAQIMTTARIAHELNNPLDAVLRYVNRAVALAGASDSADLKECLERSRDGLQRMIAIVRDMTARARNEAALAAHRPVDRIVDDAVRTFQQRAVEAGVMITTSCHQENMPSVDRNRLYQVCCNLLANALDAMPAGGRLYISVGFVNEAVVIRFEDTGVGLPPTRDRLFQPFFTTKPPGVGTGLGLSICRELIEQMGGTISADAREGGGAVFAIRIPLKRCGLAARNQEHCT